MTWFNDPARTRLGNGMPCWLTAPNRVALPALSILPTEEGGFRVITTAGGRHTEAKAASTEALVRLLTDWTNDPEKALWDYFGESPPEGYLATSEGRVSPSQSTHANAEDLGL